MVMLMVGEKGTSTHPDVFYVITGMAVCLRDSRSDEAASCGYFDGGSCLCMCNEDTVEGVCGSGSGFDCIDPASACGEEPCTTPAVV